MFGVERMTLSSRLIDGQFPNYRQLLPDTYEHELRVSRTSCCPSCAGEHPGAAHGAAAAAVRERRRDAVGTDARRRRGVRDGPVNYDGEPLEIGFNPQFLQDGLDSVDADELVIKLISPLRPGLLEAAGEDDGQGKFLYLIMPVRLNV